MKEWWMNKMKVFWTASYTGKDKYQKFYDLIGRTLESLPDLEIISPEKGNYLDMVPPTLRTKLSSDPTHLHYEAIRRGILWADAVIIEVSNEDFQLGHEATLAIQAKKHVLCLSVNENFADKIDNRYFHGAKYNRATLEEQVEDFLSLARKDLLSNRFNLFLTSSQLEFIKKQGDLSGEGASSYLRSLVEQARYN